VGDSFSFGFCVVPEQTFAAELGLLDRAARGDER
jgi:hypothetical protein